MGNLRGPRIVDPYLVAILLALLAGAVLPLTEPARQFGSLLAASFVSLLFFLYGARLKSREVIDSLQNWKLQTLILACTYLLFPIFGVMLAAVLSPLVGPEFALGLIFLSLLPSTVQSSVTFTAIAGGNIAAAVCAATISNVLGMLLTPLLAMLILGGDTLKFSTGAFVAVLVKLLLPFIVGQLLEPILGARLRHHTRALSFFDRLTIVLIVFSATASARAAGSFSAIDWSSLVGVLLASGLLLTAMLGSSWALSGLLGLNRADRIAVLMCGSKKSLTSGLPIGAILFTPSLLAAVSIPVIAFHQLQLLVCAYLAVRIARAGAAGIRL